MKRPCRLWNALVAAQLPSQTIPESSNTSPATDVVVQNSKPTDTRDREQLDKLHDLEVKLQIEQVNLNSVWESGRADEHALEAEMAALISQLNQSKEEIDRLTAEHKYKQVKLDGDKMLFPKGLKSASDVAQSETDERSAWQKLQKAEEDKKNQMNVLQTKEAAYQSKVKEHVRNTGEANKKVNVLLQEIQNLKNQELQPRNQTQLVPALMLAQNSYISNATQSRYSTPGPPPPGYQWQQRTFTVPGTSSMPGAVGPPNSGFQNVTQWELVPATQGTGGEIGPDHHARVLAEQLRATPPSERDEQKMDELRKILDESFVSKQEAQEQRLAKLSEEVSKTKETLEKRKLKQAEIVDRRMSELLGIPDSMKWDYEPNTASKTPAPSTKQTPLAVVPKSYDYRVPYVLPYNPLTYPYSPTIPNRGGATKPNMPVYNPYEYQQPGYTLKLGPMPSVVPVPQSGPPNLLLPNSQPLQPPIPPGFSSTFPQPVPSQVASPLEPMVVPSDLRMIGTKLLEIHLKLKHSEKENNPQILESLALILKQLEANWAARSKEFQSSLNEVTKQIDDLNKLNDREWGADQVTLRETVQNQIQSLNERKRDISRYLEWMRNVEQEQLAAVRVPSKAEPTKPSDESAEKPANATVLDKSK